MAHQQLVVDGCRFDAVVEGPEDGPAVLLLHGWPQTPACWDGIVPGLVAAGRRVVAPAQRGYSPGARPRPASAYRLDRLAADVVGMADALGVDRFDVVGHDWGGAVAWGLASWHADRVRTMTSLATPHPEAMLRALPRSAQVLRSAYVPVFALPWVPPRVLSARGAGPLRAMLVRSGLDEGHADAYAAALADAEAMAASLRWYRAALSPGGRRRVGPSVVPTLYMWGSGDAALGRTAAEGTAAHVEGPYRFLPLAGASHWLPEHHTAEVLTPLLEHLG